MNIEKAARLLSKFIELVGQDIPASISNKNGNAKILFSEISNFTLDENDNLDSKVKEYAELKNGRSFIEGMGKEISDILKREKSYTHRHRSIVTNKHKDVVRISIDHTVHISITKDGIKVGGYDINDVEIDLAEPGFPNKEILFRYVRDACASRSKASSKSISEYVKIMAEIISDIENAKDHKELDEALLRHDRHQLDKYED